MSLSRWTPLRADPEKTRAWKNRSRKALPQRSAKQVEIGRKRRECRDAVIARDGFRCAAAEMDTGIPCGKIPGRELLELHEVVKRSRWHGAATDPSVQVLLCAPHHDFTEAEPARATELGLLQPSWAPR